MPMTNPIKNIQAQKEIIQEFAKVHIIHMFFIVHYQWKKMASKHHK
jgi:hypothetical protein